MERSGQRLKKALSYPYCGYNLSYICYMDSNTIYMTETQYRALDIDSYSSIKVFIEDRKKYYRRFVLKEPVRDSDTPSTIFGSLVDCLLFTPDDFERRFALSITDTPKGQYGKLIEELMDITSRSVNESGEVTRELEDMLEDAYNAVKFDRNGNLVDFKRDSFEVVKRKFMGSDLEIYYRQLREAHGKEVVEPLAVENALKVIAELKSNNVTAEIVNMSNGEGITVYNQFPIIGDLRDALGEDVTEEEAKAKCLPDKLIIDHVNKEIHIYDLKTAWDNEGEFLNNYFKYKYYIQGALYFFLVVEWARKQSDLEYYKVRFPAFIVADSNNYKNPLIYTTDSSVIAQGMRGFIIKGKYYPGVVRAVKDIIWHKRTGIWNISRENYDNNGIVKIKPFET